MNSVGLKAIIPQPSLESAPQAPSSDVVITVQGDRKVLLNQEPVPVPDLGSRLKTLFAGLPAGKVIFIRADKTLNLRELLK
jgi:biopolymer transport protein ExbD